MDASRLVRRGRNTWEIPVVGSMRVPGVLFADPELIASMDDKVAWQTANVAGLPGIVGASYAMPDAHWGYGFPIGGVAAFDPERGGVISAGGVGFDIGCGVRTLLTGLSAAVIAEQAELLAESLVREIPAGLGSTGSISLDADGMDAMLSGGAAWAVERGWGQPADLERIEERGRMAGADPNRVSMKARQRQKEEMGTLGSGNHYLEVQRIRRIHDERLAAVFGLRAGDAVVSIHCGSRGLGHQIGTEFLREMVAEASRHHLALPDRELASAPLGSDLGRRYLGAMRAAINCAMANRQIITHLVRATFARCLPEARLGLLYDVSHNTCKEEEHEVDGVRRRLFVHRKGATRAFGPGHSDLPLELRDAGQPVLIGGSMGTASYILAGTEESMGLAFGSACHGAGRAMSRTQAKREWNAKLVVEMLRKRGVEIRGHSRQGLAEEAPGAYKDVGRVVEATHAAGLARKVAELEPMICIKG